MEQRKLEVSRRSFLKVSASAAAGLTLSLYLSGIEKAQASSETNNDVKTTANAFIRIRSDNRVIFVIKHLEMGQGTFTGLATLLAEELDADWSQVVCEAAPADAAKYNNLSWGPNQGTGGSTAIANSYMQMRYAGAAARHMLVAAAAEAWKVPVGEVSVRQGVVGHEKSNRTASFGELANAAAKQAIPEKIPLKDPKDYSLVGKNFLSRKDKGKTDGTAVFTQDVNLPNQLTALVAHAPRFGGKVAAVDSQDAERVAGVVKVIEIPSGVAVLAKDYWSAKKGRDALKISWDESAAFTMSSAEIMQQYKELAESPGASARQDGDPDTAFAKADKIIESAYEFPYLAHATMEPMNCVVHWHENGCDVWNGCQMQTADQARVAELFGLRPAQVNIHTLFAGGSFGRRASSTSDYTMEAARIAKAMGKGTPVKLVWSREDDMRAGYFRPMYYHQLKVGLDSTGALMVWRHRIVGQSIVAGTASERLIQEGIDRTSVEGARNLPYAIPNLGVELHTPDNIKVPVLWWRSVGSTHTAFSTESMIDEVATTTGQDPVDLRMKLLASHPRHRGVLKLAAEQAGWGKKMPKGRGMGIALHKSFNTYVAEVAEVTVEDNGDYSVDKIVCAVDCGVPVNPDVIRAQMEGGIGYGLSPVIASEIRLEEGRVRESNFHDYQVLRINQMPEIDVHIVNSDAAPTGVGEPGTPVVAPAVANALFAATGKRVYNLPIRRA